MKMNQSESPNLVLGKNSVRQDGASVIVSLTSGFETKIDLEDWAKIAAFRWSASRGGVKKRDDNRYIYARSFMPEQRGVQLHRFLTGAEKGKVVDHINGDTLDNRRSNLRVCSHAENIRNSKPRAVHGMKGVSKAKSGPSPWGATIRLGSFDTKEEAARAYDRAAKLLFPDFARLNFPNEN